MILAICGLLALACSQSGGTTTPPVVPTVTDLPFEASTSTPEPASEAKELRYLALGDSYTIGQGVADEARWPVQLVQRLRDEGYSIADAEIVAATGWTTRELSKAIDSRDLEGPYDLVSLMIGVNNQFQGLSIMRSEIEFTELLHRSIEFAGGDPTHVIVLSIPDWGVTPFARGVNRARIASEIDRFNEVNRAEAVRLGGRYVDVTPISREAATDLTLIAGDGLHPSGVMYEAWVSLVLPEVLELLGAQ